MSRDLEPWGGEVHAPRWLRRLLHRQDPVEDSEERAHERRQPGAGDAPVGKAADQAAAGPLSALYHEGRQDRQARKKGHS